MKNTFQTGAEQVVLPSFIDPKTAFTLDMSHMGLDPAATAALSNTDTAEAVPPLAAAHKEMGKIEAGEIKNPDEKRQVTHFSDRLDYAGSAVFKAVEAFAEEVRGGTALADGKPVEAVVINGIGGSALGPQLVQFAINGPYWNELPRAARNGFPKIYFLDNTDPVGQTDLKAAVDPATTIVVTVSKSGGTRETLNNMTALEAWFSEHEVNFAAHAVAVTMAGSKLDAYAKENTWLKVFPMAESIGGRTSETNIVGHVPAALTGIDFGQLVAGGQYMDELTRAPELANNPAYQLASAWYVAGEGRGNRNMVIVPYSDRLVLLGKYLQQLVMESLGKELDLDDNVVHQGLTVYGNKGGTDAHAYIQQLNDGRDDFFVTFIEVLKDSEELPMGDGMSMGDYLHAFKDGLVNALSGKGRKVIQIILESLDAFAIGMIIALYERAVAFYAELIHINAFHQPGVQAYKLASGAVNDLQATLQTWIADRGDKSWEGSAAAMAAELRAEDQVREVEGLLSKMAVNERTVGKLTASRTYRDGWVFALA
ncbi:MAG: glucose-6-phosphate isomerase [Lentisphaerae bacterium]|jgi:glucose-6-phosphate isomerase|nr:glucose-6-phosphate isomerase [Lentisphaerota bacterium]MBT5605486.1 glucose-6-phosphate isomerase [Lentisphaerota bacterium]MBT7060083.1 glucose-6-phosphate isomerase [Lentisphaerota bacterium]MBT7840857.1 glucose-6-phosphate isomerase [Lentisphaerota bacterium]